MIGMVDILEDYEAGYLDTQETLELFAELIRTRAIWYLRCSVRRNANAVIYVGYLTPDGKITNKGRTLILDEGRERSPCDANPELDAASDEPVPGPFAGPNITAQR